VRVVISKAGVDAMCRSYRSLIRAALILVVVLAPHVSHADTIQCERAISSAQGLLFASKCVQRLGEIQQNGGAIGFDLQGTGEKRGSLGVATQLRERDTQQLQQISIIRRTTN